MLSFITSRTISVFLLMSYGILQPSGAFLPNTMIRSSPLSHTYVVERAPQIATFLDNVKHENTKDVCSIILGKHLNYDKIQSIIDVSRPYYNLCNERLVADNGLTFGKAFVCTVKPEMPIGSEIGPICAAEAGRHLAIAGSVAAALNQPSCRPGKHYYLALDNTLSTCLSPDNEFFADAIKDYSDGHDHIIIYAICSDLSKKSATSEVLMKFPDSLGGDTWHLRTTYSVMSEKLFKRFSPFKKIASSIPPNTNPSTIEDLEHFDSSYSPYAQFQPPDSYTTMKSEVPTPALGDGACSQTLTLRSSIPTISAKSCVGHFQDNPAFPIAFMAAYLLDLAGKTIGKLAGEEIKFLKVCPTISNDFASSGGARIKYIKGDIEAAKLVYAGTHGLDFYCEAEEVNTAESIFYVKLKAVSSEEDNQLIAHATFFYQLIRSTDVR